MCEILKMENALNVLLISAYFYLNHVFTGYYKIFHWTQHLWMKTKRTEKGIIEKFLIIYCANPKPFFYARHFIKRKIKFEVIPF